MSEVVKFYPQNAADSPDNVLEQAIGVYDQVLILGWDKDGNFDGRASPALKDRSDVLWLVEVFKTKLMNGDFCSDED
ncbi:hypothetical protein PARHAE_02063 [Paracoccus haematequi]|uniref:Uncharacterized protein n=1 Tax=Paracoccus haematequi TaxID=2491866 RepID=A0A447IN07_9RHOB|nr:hypothetical protein [Paracoccus haematequi]VDS08878.1 hypothetical protein PARHAE_02063 [Paracoccus haematequi]